MITNFARTGAALVGSALALATVVVSAPAQAARSAAAPGWRIEKTITVKAKSANTSLASVAALSRRDAWVAGSSMSGSGYKLLVRHWTGRHWLSLTVPAAVRPRLGLTFQPGDLAALPGRNVWIFSQQGGKYLRLTGKRWTAGTLPGWRFVDVEAAIAVHKAVWVFGARFDKSFSQATPYAAVSDGHGWTTQVVPGAGGVASASALSGHDIWAVVSNYQDGQSLGAGASTVVRWNGASWQQAATQPTLPAKTELASIAATSDTSVWVGGTTPNDAKGSSEFAERWNGSGWTVNSPAAGASRRRFDLLDLVPDGSRGLWGLALNEVSGYDRLWHWSAGAWTRARPRSGGRGWALAGLAHVPGTRSTWAAGFLNNDHGADGLIAIAGPLPR